ncbi:MAG: hypothetical protein KC435_14725 [Thermomicrobiales bacterium]|nr:hypothetical protein [Thermomicrobiales bacterium]
MPTNPPPARSSLSVAAIVATVLLALGGFTLLILDYLHSTRRLAIEDAARIDLTRPLVGGVFLLLALGWLLWLWKTRGLRSTGTIVAAIVATMLLIATPLVTLQAFRSDRDLTITTMNCAADTLLSSANNALAGCEDAAIDTIMLLGGITSNDQWIPEDSSTNQVRTFADLPTGDWSATLTVDGPESTVTVYVLAERDGSWIRIGQLRPGMDSESGRLRWSGQISVNASDTNLKVQFVASANEVVPSAQLRFTVKSCVGQNTRTFDASTCETTNPGASLIQEETPDGTRTWRQPIVTLEGGVLVVANLEARTYSFRPDYATIQIQTENTDIFIIPTAMEQVEGNSITHPGDSTFDITIAPSTGVIEYTIYIFPTGSGSEYAYAP